MIAVLNDTTDAYIGSANGTGRVTVMAGGNVLVDASDDTVLFSVAGDLGIGLSIGGFGAGVDVLVLTKDTEAFIGHGSLVSGSSDTVQAESSETITSVAAAGGGGLFVGLGGGVSVEVINGKTYAYVGTGATVTATGGAINVTASDTVHEFSFAGGFAAGAVGLGGGVDVGVLNDSTQAAINGTATASGDVNVHAVSNETVDSLALSGAVGLAGLVGSVSVWAIGMPFSSTYGDNGELGE